MKRFNFKKLFAVLALVLAFGGNAYATSTQIGFPISNYSPNNSKFYTDFTIDWNTQKLHFELDLTKCNTSCDRGDGCGQSRPDCVFDLTAYTTSDIDWSTPSGQAIMHVYCSGSALSLRIINGSDPSGTYSIAGLDKSNVVIEIDNENGLTVNGVTVVGLNYLTGYFFGTSHFKLASQEGCGRMSGTYKRVDVVRKGVVNAVINNTTVNSGSIIKELKPEGKTFPFQASGQFVVTTDIDWDTQKIVAQVDLSSCSGENDFFAMTTGEGDFKSFHGTAANPNMHCYYTPNNTYCSAYFANGTDNSNSGRISISSKVVDIEVSKANALRINGNSVTNHSPGTDQYKALYKASSIKVGTGENGKNYNTTYNYIYLTTADYVDKPVTVASNRIDETMKVSFALQEDVKVQLSRTLDSRWWNTFCVPFDVSEEMVKDVFGSDVKIQTFSEMDGSVMKFRNVSSIEAGKPYLVKPASTVTDPTFNGVNITVTEPEQVGAYPYYMLGTFGVKENLATDGTNLFLTTNTKGEDVFVKPSAGNSKIKGMRAYFIVPSGTNYSAMRVQFGDATSIDEFGAKIEQPADNRIFNLQGQFVGTSLEGLHGVYVQNGKKVLVK